MQENALAQKYKRQIEQEIRIGILHRNQDGYYKKSMILGTCPDTGKPLRISGEGRDAASTAASLARNHCRRIREQKSHRRDVPENFAELAYRYLKSKNIYAEKPNLTKSEKDTLRIVENHILPFFKMIRLEELNQEKMQQFMNSFEKKGESLVKKILTLVKGIVLYGIHNEFLFCNMATLNIHKPKTKKINRRDPLTAYEMELLVRHCQSHRSGALFLTMLSCGLRDCEAMHVRVRDIDFEKRSLQVTVSKTENGVGRLLPLPALCVELLQKAAEDVGYRPDAFIFHQATDRTKPHTISTLLGDWNNLWREIDINLGATVYRNKIIQSKLPRKITPYYLRHTFATVIAGSDLPAVHLKLVLGHSLDELGVTKVYVTPTRDAVFEKATQYLPIFDALYDKYTSKSVTSI